MKLQTIEQILDALSEGKSLSELTLKLPTVNSIRWDKNNPFQLDGTGNGEVKGVGHTSGHRFSVQRILKGQSKNMGEVAKMVNKEILLLWKQLRTSCEFGRPDRSTWGWMMQDTFDSLIDYYVMLCNADNDSDDLRQVCELIIGFACDILIVMGGFLDITFDYKTLQKEYHQPIIFFINISNIQCCEVDKSYELFDNMIEDFENLLKCGIEWIECRKIELKEILMVELINYEHGLEPKVFKGKIIGKIPSEEEMEKIVSKHLYFKEKGWSKENWIDDFIKIRDGQEIEEIPAFDYNVFGDKFSETLKEMHEHLKKERVLEVNMLTDMAMGNTNISEKKKCRIEKSIEIVNLLVKKGYITQSDGEDLKEWLRLLICENKIHEKAQLIKVNPKLILSNALHQLYSNFWGRSWRTSENDNWDDFITKVSGQKENHGSKDKVGKNHQYFLDEIQKIAPPK